MDYFINTVVAWSRSDFSRSICSD